MEWLTNLFYIKELELDFGRLLRERGRHPETKGEELLKRGTPCAVEFLTSRFCKIKKVLPCERDRL